jgi:ureidoglycolate dehydrogenase (NAD+)
MTSDSKPEVRIDSVRLARFVTELFEAAGVARQPASEWAASLIWANLRGVDSHGVLRVPRYLDLLQRKSINPNPSMRVERRAGAIVVLEADRAPGAIAMTRAMAEAIACAREARIGWCAARNITHAGAVGYFALQAAQAGCAGIVMTASGPMMAYHGARVAGVSTNPLAIAFPGRERPPFMIDMSTSTVAMGKLLNARDSGRDIPPDWGIDAAGRATTDAGKVSTLLPMAGPKGSGLSFMIECLCSLTVHNPVVATALEAGGSLENPFLNGVAIAIDLSAFGDADAIRAEADRLGDAVANLPAAEGVERILLPGERGAGILRERERDGIPVPGATWLRLLASAEGLGVEPP